VNKEARFLKVKGSKFALFIFSSIHLFPTDPFFLFIFMH